MRAEIENTVSEIKLTSLAIFMHPIIDSNLPLPTLLLFPFLFIISYLHLFPLFIPPTPADLFFDTFAPFPAP